MAVEHRTMVSANVHEPKHISDSTSSDAGKVITPLSGGESELRSLTPAEVGVQFIYGEIKTEEVPVGDAIAITAAADTSLYTGAQFTNLNSLRLSNVTLDQSNGVTFNATNNTLVLPVDGDYRISGWFNIASDTANTKTGIKYTLNGTAGGATVKGDVKDVGRVQNINGFGFITASAGDELGVAIACDKSCNLHIQDFVVMVDLLRAT